MKTSLDDMVDRAPDGEIEVAGGTFKHVYEGNWKLYLENLCDAAHPWFTHRSSIAAAQQQDDEVESDGSGEIAIRQMRQNGAPYSFWESQVGIWTYPNGHSYLGDYHDDAKLVAAMNDPTFREYFAALESKKGKQETQRIMEVRRWNSNIYPNLSMMSQFQQLRVIHPISVDRTVVHTYCFKLRGAPEQLFRNTISFANIVNGTGSLVLTDDLEIYNRVDTRHGERRRRMARDRPRLPDRRARGPRRAQGQEFHQRNLHPQHVRRLARLHARRRPGRQPGSRRMSTTDTVATRESRPAAELPLARCEAFLIHEARLLDEGHFDQWLALFTPDARYWVPSTPGQQSPHDTVSLMYDDRRLLETRVRRLADPRIYSQEPRSRTSRIVTNLSLEPGNGAGGTTVRSKFVMVEYRREEQRLFAGTYLHRLVGTGDGIRIAMKRVELVNCDAPLDGLVVPF